MTVRLDIRTHSLTKFIPINAVRHPSNFFRFITTLRAMCQVIQLFQSKYMKNILHHCRTVYDLDLFRLGKYTSIGHLNENHSLCRSLLLPWILNTWPWRVSKPMKNRPCIQQSKTHVGEQMIMWFLTCKHMFPWTYSLALQAFLEQRWKHFLYNMDRPHSLPWHFVTPSRVKSNKNDAKNNTSTNPL